MRSKLLVMTVLLACLMPTSASASERFLETFSGEMGFAPRWPGTKLSRGTDSGLDWILVETPGGGANTLVANVRPYEPALDLTGRFIKVWIKVSDLEALRSMEFRLSSDRFESNYFAFGFPRYTDPYANVVRDGVWTAMSFSFGDARVVGAPDRAAIDSIGWYVEDKGPPLQTWWGGFSAVDEPRAGVVSLTFDDGYDEHHDAAEWMAEYGFRGTAYVIPDAVGETGYMTLEDLHDLDQRYDWEVAAHHETPFTSFSETSLEGTILSIQRFLVANGFGPGAWHLAYPLGRQDEERVRPLVRKHFSSARVAVGGFETLPPPDDHLLRVVNVTNETTPAEVGAAARRAREQHEWLILMFHYLVDAPKQSTEYAIDDFKLALREIEKAGVAVAPLGEVWRRCPAAAQSPCDPLGTSLPASR